MFRRARYLLHLSAFVSVSVGGKEKWQKINGIQHATFRKNSALFCCKSNSVQTRLHCGEEPVLGMHRAARAPLEIATEPCVQTLSYFPL